MITSQRLKLKHIVWYLGSDHGDKMSALCGTQATAFAEPPIKGRNLEELHNRAVEHVLVCGMCMKMVRAYRRDAEKVKK